MKLEARRASIIAFSVHSRPAKPSQDTMISGVRSMEAVPSRIQLLYLPYSIPLFSTGSLLIDARWTNLQDLASRKLIVDELQRDACRLPSWPACSAGMSRARVLRSRQPERRLTAYGADCMCETKQLGRAALWKDGGFCAGQVQSKISMLA